jgi:hypothetical protein
MKTRVAVLLVGLGLLLSAATAFAHHAFTAEFDASKHIKVQGTVTKLDWKNPHIWFYVDVKDASGKVTNWGFEMDSPNKMLRDGWTRNSMKVGDVVIVEGSGARNGSNNANAKTVILASTGKQVLSLPPDQQSH